MTQRTGLPELALSVRQPWAWAIIHAGKPLENRSGKAISFMLPICGMRAIHASKRMTQDEYANAAEFIAEQGFICPPARELQRGGIIGTVHVTGVVRESDSSWFFGPRALVLDRPLPCEFIGAAGALGYFKWQPNGASPEAPNRWMLPKDAPRQIERTGELF